MKKSDEEFAELTKQFDEHTPSRVVLDFLQENGVTAAQMPDKFMQDLCIKYTMSANSLWNVVWSPDSSRILVGMPDDFDLRVLDVRTKTEVHQVRHGHRIYCASWSPDGNTIASGDNLGNVFLWDAITLEEISFCASLSYPIARLCYHPTKNVLMLNNHYGVMLLELQGDGQDIIHVPIEWMSGLYLSRRSYWNNTGDSLFVTDGRSEIREWRVKEKTYAVQRVVDTSLIKTIACSPDGEYVLYCGRMTDWGGLDGECRSAILDVSGGKDKRRSVVRRDGSFTAACWSPCSRYFVTGDNVSRVDIWNVETMRIQFTLQAPSRYGVSDVSWSPDGKHITSIHYDEKLIIWDVSMFCGGL